MYKKNEPESGMPSALNESCALAIARGELILALRSQAVQAFLSLASEGVSTPEMISSTPEAKRTLADEGGEDDGEGAGGSLSAGRLVGGIVAGVFTLESNHTFVHAMSSSTRP